MTSPIAPGLQRKLRHVLDNKTDNPELSKNLAALSDIYTENSAQNRKNIRSIIERSVLESQKEFLDEAGELVSAIEEVHQDLGKLGEICDSMSRILRDGEMEVSGMMHELERLERSVALNEKRRDWLGEFQAKYQLPEQDVTILKQGVINNDFFKSLERVQNVHKNCRALGLSQHHRAGLDLLDEMSALQDEAFKNVCAWVQTESQSIDSPDAPEIDDIMPKAMKSLRSRPPLYSYCAEEIALSRRNSVFQRFVEALSHGPRPMEVHAADPWRYANDMLAWIHAAIATEMEILALLFEGCYDSETDGIDVKDKDGQGVDGSKKALISMEEIMSSIFESVCRPLKLRLEQMLVSSPSPLLNFQLSKLFGFYLVTIESILGENSKLVSTIRSCKSQSEKSLKDQLAQRGDRLVRQAPRPPSDLTIPDSYSDRLSIAVEIVNFYETSLQKDEDEQGDEDMDSLLSTIIQPVIDSINSGAEALDPASSMRLDEDIDLDPARKHIYIINCLTHIHRILSPYGCASSMMKMIQDHIETQVGQLASVEIAKFINGTPLENVQSDKCTESPEEIANGAMDLFTKVSDPSCLPEFPAIIDHQTRAQAVRRALESLVDVYTTAYHMTANRDTVESLHSPEDIQTLIGSAP